MQKIENQLVEQQVRALADRILQLNLAEPALFFLEAHLPLTTLASNALIFLSPVATPLFGAERLASLQTLLQEQKHVERLIELIETGSRHATR